MPHFVLKENVWVR